MVAAWIPLREAGAVVSHESALELHDLSDVIPVAVHLSLPRAKRGQRPRPGVRLHTLERPPGPSEVRTVRGVPTTSPERSIVDALDAGTQPEQVGLAIGQALARGLTTPRRLRAAAAERPDRVRRFIERARMTKDIDLNWHEPGDELLDTLLDAADHDAGDFFTFRIERAGPPEDRLGGSRRFRVSASLAGREFENFLLDIGFQVISTERVDALTTPDLLAFADVAPVTVPAIPLETQVAEKLHAYTRTYHDAQPSSRTKDLVDLVLIAELASLDAITLRRAIESTFTIRSTHPVPATLPVPPPEWSTPFAELARTVGVPTDLASAHTTAAELLDPILDGRLLNGTWNIEKRQWI